jgi:hypothetical protein
MLPRKGKRPATEGTVSEARKFAGIGNARTSKPNFRIPQAIRAALALCIKAIGQAARVEMLEAR